MARYILIDSNSGYVFGDTADFANGRSDLTPVEAARLLDESIGEQGRLYVERSSDPKSTVTGYHVYRADVRGSEAVPVVHDGQDSDTISEVMELCDYVAFVECFSAE